MPYPSGGTQRVLNACRCLPHKFLVCLKGTCAFRFLELDTDGYADAEVLSTFWQRMLNERVMHEDGLDIYVKAKSIEGMHGKYSGCRLNLSFIVAGISKDPWTYTIKLGGSETSVHDRNLLFTPHDSCKYPSSSYRCISLYSVFWSLADLQIDILSSLLAPYSVSTDAPDRVVQYAPRYRLAFTLLNEDAAAGQAVHQWDIAEAISREQFIVSYTNGSRLINILLEDNMAPILKRLSILHNFTIESQVQFHAPLAFKPQRIRTRAGDAYGLTSEDLTVFINSAEWILCELLNLFYN